MNNFKRWELKLEENLYNRVWRAVIQVQVSEGEHDDVVEVFNPHNYQIEYLKQIVDDHNEIICIREERMKNEIEQSPLIKDWAKGGALDLMKSLS